MPQQTQPLVTPLSRALSLAPPRSPPLDSWIHYLHRHCIHDLLRKKDCEIHQLLKRPESAEFDSDEDDIHKRSHELLARLLVNIVQREERGQKKCQCIRNTSMAQSTPLPTKITRYIGSTLPLQWQHDFRDSGKFRSTADGLVKLTCPLVAAGRFSEVRDFIELSRSKNLSKRWRREVIQYGKHAMQHIDLFWPIMDNNKSTMPPKSIQGTIFFVHGGAWGSGHPWMYRLVAPFFLKQGFVVAIVGYRTYPCVSFVTADLDGAGDRDDSQLCDIKSAWGALHNVMRKVTTDNKDQDSWVGNIVIGHSSGAHIALLMLVDMINEASNNIDASAERLYPDCFVGLSGPYNISNHFDFEAHRGVEQISPMKAICGNTRGNFSAASPVSRIHKTFLRSNNVLRYTPPMLLVHGIEDTTVPFTATSDAARSLRSCGLTQCHEVYLEKCGHQEIVLQFMLGGPVRGITLDYLFALKKTNEAEAQCRYSVDIKSRL